MKKTTQMRFEEEFTKDEYARIWVALIQYRKYLDFIGDDNTRTKNHYTRLAKKVEPKIYEKKVV